MTGKLTPKQQRFVKEYLIDLRHTGGDPGGIQKKTAEVTGSRLLRNAKVKEAIKQAAKERSERPGSRKTWWSSSCGKSPQTIASAESVAANLRQFVLDTNNQQWKGAFNQLAQNVDTVVLELKQREQQITSEEPQYNQP